MQGWYIDTRTLVLYITPLYLCIILFITADSDGLFFNQTYITTDVLAVDTAKTPIASIKLVVDRNLTRNDSFNIQIGFSIYPNYYYNYRYYYYHRGFMANLRVDVNEQTAEVLGQNLLYSFNVSNTTECSNGTHTFLSVLVNTYVMNITGHFHISWQARLSNGLTRYQYTYASGVARIGNGNFLTSLL